MVEAQAQDTNLLFPVSDSKRSCSQALETLTKIDKQQLNPVFLTLRKLFQSNNFLLALTFKA
jgi:hypothetical protein